MYHDISHLLSRLINGPTPLRQIFLPAPVAQRQNWRIRSIFPDWRLCWKVNSPITVLLADPRRYSLAMCYSFPLVAGTFRSGSHQSRHSASCSANNNWVSASCNGTASNIKTLLASTLRGVDRVLAHSCCKRSMKCRCSRRSSKLPANRRELTEPLSRSAR